MMTAFCPNYACCSPGVVAGAGRCSVAVNGSNFVLSVQLYRPAHSCSWRSLSLVQGRLFRCRRTNQFVDRGQSRSWLDKSTIGRLAICNMFSNNISGAIIFSQFSVTFWANSDANWPVRESTDWFVRELSGNRLRQRIGLTRTCLPAVTWLIVKDERRFQPFSSRHWCAINGRGFQSG